MNPEQWERVKEVFDGALRQDPGARDAYVLGASAGDGGVVAEVRSLLAAFAETWNLVDKPVIAPGWLSAAENDPMANRTIGPYRLIRRVGRGGMADVYLAVRADHLYRRIVAIKVIKTGLQSDEVLRRFRHERQTLAVLDHPNIVKLLDAGTTDEGVPYLVMDYVQGQPIDEHCRRLSIPERLRLFRTVCAAVHYAHQNLVIHRDLKPSNVLVTADGVPKLLDFGIAKLLRPEYADNTVGLTRSDLRPMTPDYASPEQIRGEPITTSTDVYSLGVLLYWLLTGSAPYRLKGHSALEYERAICESEPERPSVAVTLESATANEDRLERKLKGELDTIVLMALRKEPQRRYASAEQFAEDVRRYLDGLPVIACKDTVGYRTAKFVRRHKAAVTAAVLVAVSLLAGVVAVVWQSRVAERERARAEQRFDEVRQLARFVLFDLDDALRAGVTPARSVSIGKALEYLDHLAKEDRKGSLEVDLIEGYLKVGDVQGNFYGPNLGDRRGAEQSYRKALQLAEQWTRVNPDDPRPRRALARANQKLGDLLSVGGDSTQALARYRAAIEVFTALAASNPADVQTKQDILSTYEKIGFVQHVHGDLTGALKTYDMYTQAGRDLFGSGSGAERRAVTAAADAQVGKVLAARGERDAGAQRLRAALATYEQLAAADPSDASIRRRLSITYINLGDVLAGAGRVGESLEYYRKGLTALETLAMADPENQQLQRDVSLTLAFTADALAETGQTEEARRFTSAAIRVLKARAERAAASAVDHREYAWRLVTTPYADLGNRAAALTHAERAVDMSQASDPATLDTLALAYDLNGQTARAIETEERALALLPPHEVNSETAHLPKELKANLARFKNKLAKHPPSSD
jgi:non-specific serine/threonine protein kinase/serine/threonine-protein kinase